MTGIAPRRCLGTPRQRCTKRIRGRTRCDECRFALDQEREAARTTTRANNEPWRTLYRTADWRKARGQRLIHDNGQCVDCGSTHNVSVDHETPLRHLWHLYVELRDDDYGFHLAATDVDRLATRCASCHANAENERR